MSRYQWPSAERKKDRGRALLRLAHAEKSGGVLPAEAVVGTREIRSAQARVRDAPGTEANPWVPVGPSSVLAGMAGSNPRVAGRVRDLIPSPDGQRVYAATANGGVWFSSDEGNSWAPLGNWMPTPDRANLNQPAHPLVCGCLLVKFGAAADGSADDVYVGSGELTPKRAGTPTAHSGGVGILHLNRTVPQALADPFADVWTVEGGDVLRGAGVYRLARDPANDAKLLAATTRGLYKRDTVGGAWTRVTSGPFNFDADDKKIVDDVVWTSSRVWVTIATDSTHELWTSPAAALNFEKVNLGAVMFFYQERHWTRLGLAPAPTNANVVYVLGSGPKLWRVTGNTATAIQRLPATLFGAGVGQSAYDLAVAVHPDNDNIVAVGGSTLLADNEWSASLFALTVTGTNTNYTVANDTPPATPVNDATFIGNGVHADVHQIRYSKRGPDVWMWVGCDGGVFRSRAAGARYSFLACNSGLAVLEPGYVASHPVSDALLLVGSQDNGALLRVGDTVWQHLGPPGGDAGAVLFHPVNSSRYAVQTNQAYWSSNGRLDQPVIRSGGRASEPGWRQWEDQHALFYSGGDVRLNADGKVRLAIGTHRVWLVENWDPTAAATATRWITLPTGDDPLDPTRNDVARDGFGDGSGAVVACRWIKDDHLVVLVRAAERKGENTAVLLYRPKTGGGWERISLSSHANKKSDYANGDISQPTSSYLPPLGEWSDIAVHDPARGTNGSFYIATTGFSKFNNDTLEDSTAMDTLWWYDGVGAWRPTRLRSTGTKAPAYVVVRDPVDLNTVYAGTAVGVWKGVLTFNGTTPDWAWTMFSKGLPEAAVQDLSFHHSGAVKILRAAIQARGVWEIDLSAAPVPVRQTYLRTHLNDVRRSKPVNLTNPTDSGPATWPWHASPDIRIRRAPGAPVPAPPMAAAASWAGAPPNCHDLWTFQTALHKEDPLCVPNGTWTALFTDRLRKKFGAGITTINRARWQAVVTAANTFATPWNGPEPSEADLMELVIENSSAPSSSPAYHPPAVARVIRAAYKVDVMAHYRDLRPLAKNQVRVTLLRRRLPGADPATWPIAIAADWKTRVEQLMSGAPPAGWSLPDNWTPADAANRTLGLNSDVDARTPRAATFDVTFTARGHFLLLAIVHSTPDPVTVASLDGANVRELILNCHQTAARVVQVV